MPTDATTPAAPATTGSAKRRRSRSSPRSNSRRASRPTTKKKNVIRPLFTHPRRSSATVWPPTSIDSVVSHSEWYDDGWTLTQTSAATVAARRTAAPPVSVRRNSRNGVWRLRAHAVRVEKGEASVFAPVAEVTERSSRSWPVSVIPVANLAPRGVLRGLGDELRLGERGGRIGRSVRLPGAEEDCGDDDGDEGQPEQRAERDVEAVRHRGSVAAAVGRGERADDREADRPADLPRGVRDPGGDSGVGGGDACERSDRHRNPRQGHADTHE